MKRLIKLIVLILMSLSVYFIYKYTNNKNIKLVSIGDSLSIGINSYGIKEYSYSEYYKDYLASNNKKITLIDNYSSKDLTIKELLEKVKTNNQFKRDLCEAHILILNVGYYDLVHEISNEDEMNIKKLNKILRKLNDNYQELIDEIEKYYNNSVIIVGYYPTNKNEYYLDIGIKELNKILESRKEVEFIDIYYALNNKKYFSNPNSYYPNILGYRKIADKIITKRLEKEEKF